VVDDNVRWEVWSCAGAGSMRNEKAGWADAHGLQRTRNREGGERHEPIIVGERHVWIGESYLTPQVSVTNQRIPLA
jgi:hypothetical protein